MALFFSLLALWAPISVNGDGKSLKGPCPVVDYQQEDFKAKNVSGSFDCTGFYKYIIMKKR